MMDLALQNSTILIEETYLPVQWKISKKCAHFEKKFNNLTQSGLK